MSAHSYAENIHRLALGLEPIDVLSGRTVDYPVRVDVEYGIPHVPAIPVRQLSFVQQRGRQPVAMTRHETGRYSLVYQAGISDELDLRLYDHHRRYVPRRLKVPLMTLDDVLTIESNAERDFTRGRIRRPVLFPGAAYHVVGRATGLRGRVLRDSQPMPWCWVEAHSQADEELVGRARGDERGEFLLLIDPLAAAASELQGKIDIDLSIQGPDVAPVPPDPALPDQDSLWSLPLEQLPGVGEEDGVSPGTDSPIGYVEGVSAELSLPIGRVSTGTLIDDFIFIPP